MPTVVIFGANGQDGHYLGELYSQRGWHVVGVSRSGPIAADVGAFDDVDALVRQHRPDVIYQLAATSSTRHDVMFENHRTIGTGALNVLEAVHRSGRRCKVLLAGSGLQFENTGAPISESTPFAPTSSYAVERIHSVYAARYFRSLGVPAYVGYLFHHESPLRKPSHVSQRIVQTARRIAGGSAERLEMGDITVEKEWGFAGDITRGMMALVEQDTVFEAAIGTGVARPIEYFLDRVFRSFHMDWRTHTMLREGFKAEYARLVSDPRTMFGLGWRPETEVDDLVALMLRG